MTDLECRELVELVTDFLDHSLDPRTEQRVVEHLAHCDGCSRYLEQLRTTIQELGGLEPAAEQLSPQGREALLRAFRAGRPGAV